MNPARSDELELFRATTQRFLERASPLTRVRELVDDPTGFERDLWTQGAELGWFSLLVPPEYDGGTISGAGIVELALLASEFGRLLTPGPVLPGNLVASAIVRSGSESQRSEHLKSIVCGETVATWAVAETNGTGVVDGLALRASEHGPGFRLDGTKTMVQDAHVADLLLVVARTARGLTQFLVPAGKPGITVECLESLDLARRFCAVHFDGVVVPAAGVVGEVDGAADDVERLLQLAAVLQCAESVGAAQRAFEITLDYARERKAFGRAIGSFQAIKHRLADMAGWLENAKAVTEAAAIALERDVDAAELTSVASAYVSQRAPLIARDCLQIHGGIGFTWEHDIHLYLRRLETNRVLYGDADHHLDRLAEVVGL